MVAELPPLPVTLLSGFLGSGKTSLLKHILLNRQGLRVAVILNEISEVNIDSFALEGSRLLQAEEKVVELSNGCICCTLREDLLKQLRELHASGRYDAVLVESSGIAEPLQTAETFLIDLEDGHKALQDGIAPLDCCVTVLDASTAQEYLGDRLAADSGEAVKETPTNGETISDLFFDQLSFANVVVLNKVDLLIRRHHARLSRANGSTTASSAVQEADQRALDALKAYDVQFPPQSRMTSSLSSSTVSAPQHSAAMYEALVKLMPLLGEHSAVRQLSDRIRAVCPRASEIVLACHGMVQLDKVLRTGHFTLEFATKSTGWMHDILTGEAHVPETLEYGVSTTYFTAERPFHPERFFLWLDTYFVVRQTVPGDDVDGSTDGDVAQAVDTDAHPELDELESDEGSVSSSWADGNSVEEEEGSEGDDNAMEESDECDNEEEDDEEGAREEQSILRRERYGNLFRGKGYVWLGNPKRLGQVASLSQAGSELQMQYVGTWDNDFIDIVGPQNGDSSKDNTFVSAHVDRPVTQRPVVASQVQLQRGTLGPSPSCVYAPPSVAGQRLVFIGQHLESDQLLDDLRAALLTDEEWITLQQHMHTAMLANEAREKSGKKMSWRDRGWLNDIFEDYFEDFPLPLTPPRIPPSLLKQLAGPREKSNAKKTTVGTEKSKKRQRVDEW